MKSMLLICRAIVWVTSIIFLMVARKTKKRSMLDCVKWVSLGSFLYLGIDVFAVPYIFDIEYGLEIIIPYGITAISALFLLVDAFICQRRSKKIQMAAGEDIQRWPVLYLLVAVCLFSVFGLEYQVLQDAHVLFVHESDGLSGDNYSVAITDKAVIPIEIGDRYYKTGEATSVIAYNAYWDIDNKFIISAQKDPDLTEADVELIQTLCQFDNYNKTEKTNRLNTENDYRSFYIRKVVNTDYYLVSCYMSDTPGPDGILYGEAVFVNDELVGQGSVPSTNKIFIYKGE